MRSVICRTSNFQTPFIYHPTLVFTYVFTGKLIYESKWFYTFYVPRYHNLSEPVGKRKQMLEDARNYQQFLHDVEDEESWIREKEPIASSLHTGKYSNLRSVYTFARNGRNFFVNCFCLHNKFTSFKDYRAKK